MDMVGSPVEIVYLPDDPEVSMPLDADRPVRVTLGVVILLFLNDKEHVLL
jgi:hypothetical protein